MFGAMPFASMAGDGLASMADVKSSATVQQIDLALPYVPPHIAGAKVRTPETLAPLLVDRLSKERPVNLLALATTQADSSGTAPLSTHADAFLIPLDVEQPQTDEAVVIPTGYRAGVMAIMRTDTDIERWEDLRGRIVCLTEESGLAGQLHERYGATEKLYRAPADALLELRIGGCDATVHDSTMLHALLEFPEWEKFSARLPVQDVREWAFVLPQADAALTELLQNRAREWQDSGLLAKLTQQSARDIAFEVYMDQEVPDCH